MVREIGIVRGGLANQVYKVVRDRILAGDYPPGHRLTVLALAEELGVSSTPVREALSRLEATGLVQHRSHRGFQVRLPPGADELDSIMETRLLVEPPVAALACERGGTELVETLRSAYEQQVASGEEDTVESFLAYMDADELFHSAIWEASGNKHLQAAMSELNGVIHRWRAFKPGVILDRDLALVEHEAILRAFETGNPDLVAEAMRSHVARQRARIREQNATNSVPPA